MSEMNKDPDETADERSASEEEFFKRMDDAAFLGVGILTTFLLALILGIVFLVRM
jgi:lipopolysaccharide/colanic/teichoic acid biosynthesis glycosyltransferase